VSWNPAVPPPPVTGAAGGTLPAGEAVTVFVTVAAGSAALELTPGVPDAELTWDEAELPEDAEEAEPPGEAEVPDDAVDELVTDGENTVGVLLDEPEVHAETATGASSVRAPQPRTVSLAPNVVPAVIPRTFMDPPHAPGS
jgi:hypothetical protein